MNGPAGRELRPVRLKRFVWALICVWTLAIGATLTWELIDEYDQARAVARAEARGAFYKEFGLLEWYGFHRGVYLHEPAPRPAHP